MTMVQNESNEKLNIFGYRLYNSIIDRCDSLLNNNVDQMHHDDRMLSISFNYVIIIRVMMLTR